MKDKLRRTWSLKVKKGDRFFRLRRLYWKFRFFFSPRLRRWADWNAERYRGNVDDDW